MKYAYKDMASKGITGAGIGTILGMVAIIIHRLVSTGGVDFTNSMAWVLLFGYLLINVGIAIRWRWM